jgi:hypothetical protein
MIDRMVCADGGNPDPSSTHGKTAEEAKALELKGWSYPRHLAGRYFGIVVHGDSVGASPAKLRAFRKATTQPSTKRAGGTEPDSRSGQR